MHLRSQRSQMVNKEVVLIDPEDVFTTTPE